MSKLKMLSTEHSADTPFAGRGIGHFNPVPGQGSSMVPLVGVRELKSLHGVRKKSNLGSVTLWERVFVPFSEDPYPDW